VESSDPHTLVSHGERIDYRIENVDKSTSPTAAAATISNLLVTTKAHQVAPAVRSLCVGGRVDPAHTNIFLLCNGMGVYESLMEEVFTNTSAVPPNIFWGTTSHGCYRDAVARPFHVHHCGVGAAFFGNTPGTRLQQDEDSGAAAAHAVLGGLQELNVQAGLSYGLMLNKLLEKLAVNACINPVTALLECRNGALLSDPHARALLEDLCGETSAVLQALHERESPLSMDVSRAALLAGALDVAARTAANASSMQQDVALRRPTEIDFISGYLLRLASEYEVEMPRTKVLTQLIKAKGAVAAV